MCRITWFSSRIPLPPKPVPCVSEDLPGCAGVVHLGQTGHGRGQPSGLGEDLGFLAGLVSDARLSVEASMSWDWSRTVEAVEALRQRRVTGKVLLTVG